MDNKNVFVPVSGGGGNVTPNANPVKRISMFLEKNGVLNSLSSDLFQTIMSSLKNQSVCFRLFMIFMTDFVFLCIYDFVLELN